MNNLDKQYQLLLQNILDNGIIKEDRTGTGTKSIFATQIRHKMSEGFPLLTTKKMHWKSIVTELIWFLRGDTNIKYLVDNDCHIWDGDAYKNYDNKNKDTYFPIYTTKEDFINAIKINNEFAKQWGDLGPIYGKQWRCWGGYIKNKQTGYLHKTDEGWVVKWSDLHSFAEGTHWMTTPIQDSDQSIYNAEDEGRKVNFKNIILEEKPNSFFPIQVAQVIDNSFDEYVGGVDQIKTLINDLKSNPDSRRLMVNAWSVGEIDKMILPPCHYGFQVYTRELTTTEKLDLLPNYNMGLVNEFRFSNLRDVISDEEFNKIINESNVPKRAISLMWNQRSVDTFLGLPFNIASYGLLLEIIAKIVNMVPDELIGNLGDTHLYLNHLDQANEQILREPFELPKLNILKTDAFWKEFDVPSFGHLDPIDFQIENYQFHPSIKAPLSN